MVPSFLFIILPLVHHNIILPTYFYFMLVNFSDEIFVSVKESFGNADAIIRKSRIYNISVLEGTVVVIIAELHHLNITVT